MAQSLAEALTRVPMSRALGETFGRAQSYAREQGHRRVTLEHLLLALCEDPDAALVLQACQLDVSRLATDASGFIGRIEDRLQPGELADPEADPDLLRILEYAAAAAHQSRRREINGAIVLAAVVGEGRSAAAQMLRAQGLTFEETIKALQRAAAAARQQPPQRPAVPEAPPAPAMPAPRPGGGQRPSAEEILASVRERITTGRPQVAARPPAAQPDAELPPPPPMEPASVPPAMPASPPAYAPTVEAEAPSQHEAAPPRLPPREPPLPPMPAPEHRVDAARPPTPPPLHPAPLRPPVQDQPAGAAPPPWPQPAPAPAARRPSMPPPAPLPPLTPPAPPQPTLSRPPRRPEVVPPPSPAPPPWPDPRDGTSPFPPRADAGRAPPPPGGPPPQAARVGANLPVPAGKPFDLGQLIENVPRTMRVGVPEIVEVRIARGDLQNVAIGMEGRGAPIRHDLVVTRAMSVKLRAPDGGMWIETASPETQWIENRPGLMTDDFATWRWTVMPERRGATRLQLVAAARTVGADGLAAETALPDQIIEVRVSVNYSKLAKKWGGWAIAAVIGGALAKFGDVALSLGYKLVGG